MAPRDPAGSWGGIAHNLRDLAHLPRGLALARLGYDLKRPVFALPIYRYSLTGAAPTALAATPPDPWPGDAGRGAEIIQGVFDLAGQRLLRAPQIRAGPNNTCLLCHRSGSAASTSMRGTRLDAHAAQSVKNVRRIIP